MQRRDNDGTFKNLPKLKSPLRTKLLFKGAASVTWTSFFTTPGVYTSRFALKLAFMLKAI
jgi:hypothetical protein